MSSNQWKSTRFDVYTSHKYYRFVEDTCNINQTNTNKMKVPSLKTLVIMAVSGLAAADTTNNILNGSPLGLLKNGVLNSQGSPLNFLGKRDTTNNILNNSPLSMFQNGILNGFLGGKTLPLGKRDVTNNIMNDSPLGLTQDGLLNFDQLNVDVPQYLKRSSTTNNILNGSPLDILNNGIANGLLDAVPAKRVSDEL